MSFLKRFRLALAVLGSFPVLNSALPANAQTTDNQPVNIPFAASIHTGEKIGFEEVRRINLTVGTNEFAFVLPRGLNLRVDASAPDKITISSADCSYFLTVRLISFTGQNLGEGELNALYKNLVLTQYDGASALEESSVTADGQSGPAFEANWYVGNTNTRRVVRVGFVPTQAGILECSLVTDPKKSAEAKSALSTVLMTLRSNRAGKLENLVLADKS